MSEPRIDDVTLRYARVLDLGTRIGFVVLLVTFAGYAFELLPAAVSFDRLAQYWSLPVDQYLRATGAPVGWAFIGRLGESDSLTFVGIAIIAVVTLVCYAAVLPRYLARGDRLYAFIVIVELAVLVAAAAGWGAGH